MVALYPSEKAVTAAGRVEVSATPARSRLVLAQKLSWTRFGYAFVKTVGAVVRVLLPVPAVVLVVGTDTSPVPPVMCPIWIPEPLVSAKVYDLPSFSTTMVVLSLPDHQCPLLTPLPRIGDHELAITVEVGSQKESVLNQLIVPVYPIETVINLQFMYLGSDRHAACSVLVRYSVVVPTVYLVTSCTH